MGLLDNGGRELGQWPPFPLKHFQEKWNPVFVQKMQSSQCSISGKAALRKRAPAADLAPALFVAGRRNAMLQCRCPTGA
jgi:hypothetical protein